MIFNEMKCHVKPSLGLVGECIPCIPPVFAPGYDSQGQYELLFGPHYLRKKIF